ncbi:MAG TPA: hypothetical protein VMV17_08620 [Streptosporangiaceae bacterium]|nr:hypothetical protein [Streptosporangiaceae bacterium]
MKRASALRAAEKADAAPLEREARRPVGEQIAGRSAGHRTMSIGLNLLSTAIMALLGEQTWYLPRWLSWLPGRRGPVQALPAGGGR